MLGSFSVGSQQNLKMFSRVFRRFSGCFQEVSGGSQEVLKGFSEGSQQDIKRLIGGSQGFLKGFSRDFQFVLKGFFSRESQEIHRWLFGGSQQILGNLRCYLKALRMLLGPLRTSQEVLEFKGSVVSKVNQRVKTQFLFIFEFWSWGSQKLKALAVM